MFDPYLTLPHGEGVLPYNAEASSGPMRTFISSQMISSHQRSFSASERRANYVHKCLLSVPSSSLDDMYDKMTFSSHSRSLLCVNICILKFVPITIDTIVTNLLTHFYRAMLCIARTMLWQDVRLSVRLSCVQTAKSIVNILSPPDSSIILVFYERSEIRRSL